MIIFSVSVLFDVYILGTMLSFIWTSYRNVDSYVLEWVILGGKGNTNHVYLYFKKIF